MTKTLRFSMLIIILVCFLIFYSCNYNTGTTENDNINNNQSLSFSSFKNVGDGCSSKNGYYRILPRENCSNNIYYIDYKSKIQTVLCSRPECMHESDTCSSYFEYTSGGISPFTTNNQIILLFNGTTNADAQSLLQEDALPKIVSMDFDGNNRKTIFTFKSFEIIKNSFAYDDENIYFVKETYENISKTGNLPKRFLCEFNFSTNSAIDLQELGLSEEIIGVYNNSIILSETKGLEIITNETSNLKTNIKVFDVKKQKLNTIFSHSASLEGRLFKTSYYLFNKKNGELSVFDFTQGGDAKTICRSTFNEQLLQNPCKIKTIWNEYLYVEFEQISNDFKTITPLVYAINLKSGIIKEIKLKFNLNSSANATINPVEIVAEHENNFLVITGTNRRSISFPTAQASITLEYFEFEYSLISKENYLNSDASYIKINNIDAK